MKALITGASGFIGRYLVEHLCQQGVDVFTLGRNEVSATKKHYVLNIPWQKETFVELIKDIQPDYFFHLAGASQTTDLQQAFTVNTCLGADIIDAIRMAGLDDTTKCLIFGSAAEYGLVNESALPINEKMCCQPYSDYGLSKLAQTHYANAWSKAGGNVLVVRPFTILGKGMPTSMAIGSFAAQIQAIAEKGDHGVLHTGNIDISRDFIDVRDVVRACWQLINLDQAYGKVINICSNQALTLRNIIEYMIELTQIDISVKTESSRMRKVDIKTHYGDNSELLRLLGSYEFISWQSSVKQMLDIS